MTFKEFCKKYDDIKMKYDILVLAELINLYNEYGRYKITPELVYTEIHDVMNYSKKQI